MNGKSVFRVAITLLSLLMMNAVASDVATLPRSVDAYGLELVGSGEFRKFGFHLYDASYWRADETQALRITYRKNIAADRLVKRTFKEWERLDISSPSSTAWSNRLTEIWPDVSSGDTLIAVVDEITKQTEFFDGTGRSLGRINDPEFGPAFLGIWLDPDTSASRLRTALVGAENSSS